MRKIFRVITINFSILVALISMIEVGLRLTWTLKQCLFTTSCNFSRITSIKMPLPDNNIGLTQYDELLGYTYSPNFDQYVTDHSQEKAKVTINKDGFRKNENNYKLGNYSILALGDSFTFGDQVDNSETWPSCLERSLERPVANAGVGGFGAAQSVLRGIKETKKRDFDQIILSILVNDDFNRDQYSIRGGWLTPAVVIVDNKVVWADILDKMTPGTKNNPFKINRYSMLVASFRSKTLMHADVSGLETSTLAPNAAPIDQLINFTVEKFASLPGEKKVIVLQYNEYDFYENAHGRIVKKKRRLSQEIGRKK